MKGEEEERKDDDLVNISVRDMTPQERNLLKVCSVDEQCQSNLHIWHLERDAPKLCHLFVQMCIESVAVGSDHLVVLTSDKCVFTQGFNTYGQLGVGDTSDYGDELCKVSAFDELKVERIACGSQHSVALCKDGSLYTWGDSRHGQCGHGHVGVFPTPTKVKLSPLRRTSEMNVNKNVDIVPRMQIAACGDKYTVMVDSHGITWMCGLINTPDKSQEEQNCTLKPKIVEKLKYKKAIGLACGEQHCVIITQDDFDESHFNLQAPNYRTVSVTSAYQSEGQQENSEETTSKIPFLRGTFYNSKSDEIDMKLIRKSMRRSHSDPQIDVYSNNIKATDPGFFVSEFDLRKLSRHNTLKETNRNLALHGLLTYKESNKQSDSPDKESVASSRYFSALDVNSTLSRDKSSRASITSISSRTSTFTLTDADTSQSSIFSGRKSLFEEGSESNLQRGQSIGLSQRSITNVRSGIALMNLTESDENNSKSTSVYTEIWSWGKNTYGQLGLGDSMDRAEPILVEKLIGKNVVQVAAGSDHSIAITAHGQVYSWGDNTFGQLAHTKTLVNIPKKIKVLAGLYVWDIAAGRNQSLFLGDVSRKKTDVYFCGELDCSKVNESISTPVIKIVASSKKRSESWWRLSRRAKRTRQEQQNTNIDIQVRKFTHFNQDELVRSICANESCFGCSTNRNSNRSDVSEIYKFARSERLFYQHLTIIHCAVVQPFTQTESWSHITKLVGGESLTLLIDCFVDLLNSTATVISHLTNVIRHNLSIQELFSYLFSDSFRATYERYSTCFSDAMAVGILHSCNKGASATIFKVKDLAKDLEKHLSLSVSSFENLLKAPLMRLHAYPDIAKQVYKHYKNTPEGDQLKEVISRWGTFSEQNTKRLISANVTRKYWEGFHKKLTEALKDPKRRVLKSSRNDPLSLARASRLSNHSYILCNDVFVHVQFNRNFQVFPLVTLWVEGLDDTAEAQNAIQVISPEERFVLSAGTPDGKKEWMTLMNQAISACLSACLTNSLDIDTTPKSVHVTAASAREASYVFMNDLKYRYAHYKGMWFKGRPHGRGKMSWDDGTYYEGEFVFGLFHGGGKMRWPHTTLSPIEKVYEGEWSEGSMNGHGKMKYGNSEEYIGNFKNGDRQGHGMLKTFNKGSLETIYIGDWANEVKHGYGVLEYNTRGEKYMGMWVNDQRQGYGVVVTVDGVYYEGRFMQNKLAGKGILLSEDETCYEGEFTADMLLSGKGVLTLPNGDFLDGTFYGVWGDNIKVNATFSKFSNPLKCDITNRPANLLESTNFAIDADMKWNSLFRQCYAALGCSSDAKEVDAEKAWHCAKVAVLKYLETESRKPFDMNVMNHKKKQFHEFMQMATNLKSLQDLLSKMLDTRGHPLNLLVDGLADVYRATYVGVGAHRRLLPHAVAEAKSYVKRLFHLLRVLFPDLHDEEFVMLSNDAADGVQHNQVNSVTLLHPLLLPRLYPPLFTLYALHTMKTDGVYTEKLYYLNKRKDVALMSFLGVKRAFWLVAEKTIEMEEKTDATQEGKAYSSAIEMLNRISTTYNPMGKIEIIRRTFAKIHELIDEHYKGRKQHILAMDDLFPLFQYIVIRAKVPHLGSEIKFIEDLVEDSTLTGEAGHMLTTLSACYFQIQQERDRD